jgi:hypothetical protein
MMALSYTVIQGKKKAPQTRVLIATQGFIDAFVWCSTLSKELWLQRWNLCKYQSTSCANKYRQLYII